MTGRWLWVALPRPLLGRVGGSLSGSHALFGLRPFNVSRTPSSLIWISRAVGWGVGPLVGAGSLSFLLKTKVYCLFRMLALPCVFETRVPSDFNASLPQLSILLDLMKDQNLLHTLWRSVGLHSSFPMLKIQCTKQRSSLNVGPRTLTGNKVAGPIIHSFHLPKMSGNSSGWPSVALDFIALEFPVHSYQGSNPLQRQHTALHACHWHLIDLNWVSQWVPCLWIAAVASGSGMVHVLSAWSQHLAVRKCQLLRGNCPAVAVVLDCQTTENCFP